MEKNSDVMTAPVMELRPTVDVVGGNDEVTLYFEVPGANSKSIDIEVENGVLYVNAATSLRREGKKVLYKRAFQISDAVDVANISAETADGILTLVLPKSERAKVHKVAVH